VLFEKWENVIYPEAYLRTVAFRRFHQQRTIYEQPLDSHDNHGGAAARDPVELEEETRAVLAVLRQLPLTQRQVMALYYDQFTIGEISEILGMTQMAVRQNLKRAREKLKTALGLDQPRLRRAA
jgi:RNA polymerase sigma-70 factor (ECF subfamily)